MKKEAIKNLENEILNTFNKYKDIENEIFLRNNVIFAENKGHLIVFIKNVTLHNSFKYPNQIKAYIITKNNNSFNFEEMGGVLFTKKADLVKINLIDIKEEYQKQGYGTLLIKSFERFIADSYSNKIKITGSFAPYKIENTAFTKTFYNKNGYKVYKSITKHKPLIKKTLKIKNVKNLNKIENLRFLNTTKEQIYSL